MDDLEKLVKRNDMVISIAFVLLLVLAMVTTAIGTAYFIWKNKPLVRVECIERTI